MDQNAAAIMQALNNAAEKINKTLERIEKHLEMIAKHGLGVHTNQGKSED